MLRGQEIDRLNRPTKLLKLPNHRGELDGFGTGADYRKNLQLRPCSESDRGNDAADHRKTISGCLTRQPFEAILKREIIYSLSENNEGQVIAWGN